MIEISGARREVLVSLRWLLHARRLVVLLSLDQLRLVQDAPAVFIYAKKRHPERSHILNGVAVVVEWLNG